MSVIITARKMVSSSGMVKNWGWKIPLRATSIMPLEKVTPAMMPQLAMTMMVVRDATREPMEELRKLTASLLTPTMISKTAIRSRMPTPIMRSSMDMGAVGPFWGWMMVQRHGGWVTARC